MIEQFFDEIMGRKVSVKFFNNKFVAVFLNFFHLQAFQNILLRLSEYGFLHWNPSFNGKHKHRGLSQ